MDYQELITYILLGIAAVYLYIRFFGKRKKNKDKGCDNGSNCGCS